MPRTRRTVIDGGFDTGGQSWNIAESQAGFIPGAQYVGFELGFDIYVGGQARYDSVTLWSAGLLSLGPATQAQIDFMASGASPFPDAAGGNPGFPGEFIALNYSGDTFSSFDFGIGVVDYEPEFSLFEAVPTAFFDLGGTQIILDEQGFTVIDVPGNARFGAEIFAGSIPDSAGSGAGEALTRDWYDPFWFTFQGSPGADVLSGTDRNETLEGGAGLDEARFAGLASEYRFGRSADGYLTVESLTSLDGRDALRDIERLVFQDRDLTLTPGGERRLDLTPGGRQGNPVILGLADGSSVVAWDSDYAGIRARSFGPDGQDLAPGARVNAFTGGFQYGPRMAALEGGGYVIVWTSAVQDGSGSGVYLQRFTADGVASGPETRVNTFTTNDQENPSVAALTGGGFVVVWESFGQDGSGDGIYAQRFLANGAAAGPEVRVNLGTTGYQLKPSVQALPGGGWVVVWESWEGNDVLARVYAADGSTAGVDLRVNTFTAGYQNDASVVVLRGGDFVVVWTSEAQDGEARGIFAQRFGSDGRALGAEFRVNTTTAGDQTGPVITPLAGGGFVVAWTSFAPAGGDADLSVADVFVQRYDASGASLGGETRVNTRTVGLQEAPAVAALAGGGFVVAWSDSAGGGRDLWLQRWTEQGTRAGVETRINTQTAGANYAVDLSASPDGGFSATWVSAMPDGSDGNVFLQRFDAAGAAVLAVVTGTAGDDRIDLGGSGDLQASGGNGNDTYVVDSPGDRIEESGDTLLGGVDTVISSASHTLGNYLENLVLTGETPGNGIGNARGNTLTGNAAANTLNGNGGADSLSGGGGADKLSGGQGNDTLRGDAGDDTLTGSTGRDLLEGGAGSDLYVADGLDTVVELPGEGVDTLQGTVSLRAPENVENIVLTGTPGASATGNILANRLSGNAGGNTLLGAGGNDTLVGNGGADTLSGGVGKDQLIGGAGGDHFLFASPLSALNNVDTVVDFVRGEDVIVLDTRIFSALDASAGLDPSQVRSAPGVVRAADATDRIIYNQTTGALFYDPDGLGGVDAIRFATIGTAIHPALDASDFLLSG